jgi:hypothetical protein
MEQSAHANFPAVASAWQPYSTSITMGKIWAEGKWKKEQFFILFFKEPVYSKFQIWLKGYVNRTACFDC